MVNKTSALENCETSAVGRALANYQYQGAKKRASLEEVVKVYRQGGEISQTDASANLLKQPVDLHHMGRKAPATAQRTQQLGSKAEPSNDDGPTAKQLALLRSKNYEGAAPTTKREASRIIDELMNA